MVTEWTALLVKRFFQSRLIRTIRIWLYVSFSYLVTVETLCAVLCVAVMRLFVRLFVCLIRLTKSYAYSFGFSSRLSPSHVSLAFGWNFQYSCTFESIVNTKLNTNERTKEEVHIFTAQCCAVIASTSVWATCFSSNYTHFYLFEFSVHHPITDSNSLTNITSTFNHQFCIERSFQTRLLLFTQLFQWNPCFCHSFRAHLFLFHWNQIVFASAIRLSCWCCFLEHCAQERSIYSTFFFKLVYIFCLLVFRFDSIRYAAVRK